MKVHGSTLYNFPGYVLNETLTIKRLLSFYTYERTKAFRTIRERHNFWEMVYVDKGELNVITDSWQFVLHQGDLAFYTPNDFHQAWAYNETAPSLINIGFECESPHMNFFANKLFKLDEYGRMKFATILNEIRSVLREVNTPNLVSSEGTPFAADQLIKINLEALLIHLYRTDDYHIKKSVEHRPQLTTKKNADNEIVKTIVNHMKASLGLGQINLQNLCKKVGLGRTQLIYIFKSAMGQGPMEYYNNLKLQTAKSMISEESYNFTQIAEQLGYTSLSNFTRFFKSKTGMSPTEYARSIRARIPHYHSAMQE